MMKLIKVRKDQKENGDIRMEVKIFEMNTRITGYRNEYVRKGKLMHIIRRMRWIGHEARMREISHKI
jgi:hypothetical protein